MEAVCSSCNNKQEVERVDGSEDTKVFCLTCGDEFSYDPTEAAQGSDSTYNNYAIGRVCSVEAIPKQKDLKKVVVDIIGNGNVDSAVQVVTNAKYIDAGWLVIVAMEGAAVPAGSDPDEDSNAIRVKACAVGGVMSKGMLCDAPMLGWTGGAKGSVQQLPDSFVVGTKPPAARPRG